MKNFHRIAIAAIMLFGVISCKEVVPNEDPTTTGNKELKLECEVVDNTLNIRWEAIDGATDYVYSINGYEQITKETSASFGEGSLISGLYDISVSAVGTEITEEKQIAAECENCARFLYRETMTGECEAQVSFHIGDYDLKTDGSYYVLFRLGNQKAENPDFAQLPEGKYSPITGRAPKPYEICMWVENANDNWTYYRYVKDGMVTLAGLTDASLEVKSLGKSLYEITYEAKDELRDFVFKKTLIGTMYGINIGYAGSYTNLTSDLKVGELVSGVQRRAEGLMGGNKAFRVILGAEDYVTCDENMRIVNDGYGEGLELYFTVPSDATRVVPGKYTGTNYDYQSTSIVQFSTISDYSLRVGSHYYCTKWQKRAMLAECDVTVGLEGDIYTIEGSFKDGQGYTVSFNYNGEIPMGF